MLKIYLIIGVLWCIYECIMMIKTEKLTSRRFRLLVLIDVMIESIFLWPLVMTIYLITNHLLPREIKDELIDAQLEDEDLE